MISRQKVIPVLWAILTACLACFLFVYLRRTSYAWLSAHFESVWDYHQSNMLFWTVVITFAFDRNFKTLGLHLPRRDSLFAGLFAPLLLFLTSLELVGHYLAWNPTLAANFLYVGIIEELQFRGCITARLRPLGLMGSAVISSILFALIHSPDMWMGHFLIHSSTDFILGCLRAFCFGMFFSGIRFYTNSLLPCILLHALWDYVAQLNPSNCGLFYDHAPTPGEVVVWIWTTMGILLIYGLVLLRLSRKRSAADL